MGLFWRRANRLGAILSMGGGTIAYCLTQGLGFKFMGLHQITIGITVSLAFFLLGAYLGKPQEEKVLQVFFPSDPDPKDLGDGQKELCPLGEGKNT